MEDSIRPRIVPRRKGREQTPDVNRLSAQSAPRGAPNRAESHQGHDADVRSMPSLRHP